MSQTIDKIHSCYPLFEQDEYQTLFQNKKTLEEAHDAQRVQEVFAWTTTAEYEALNFQREALTVDPAKACQPLGARTLRAGVRRHPALRARLPGLRRLFSHLL
ncbi:nitrogenase (molybdenum-iron) subunit beta [Klebsiella variicola]|nr:nitrogenase (molybdenum-iron) subunit beta [Klebsiella variicola]